MLPLLLFLALPTLYGLVLSVVMVLFFGGSD